MNFLCQGGDKQLRRFCNEKHRLLIDSPAKYPDPFSFHSSKESRNNFQPSSDRDSSSVTSIASVASFSDHFAGEKLLCAVVELLYACVQRFCRRRANRPHSVHSSDSRDIELETMRQDLPGSTKSLVYVTPLVSLLLFAGNFLWLAKLQTAVNDLSRENTEILRTIGLPSDVGISEPDRIKRQSDLGFEDLFSQIAVKQLQALKATCTENQELCIEGPKGNTGPKGEKGDQGIRGMRGTNGAKGSKGDIGLRGEKGSKGDAGSKLIPVDPPQFIAKPVDTIGKQGGQAVFECKANGYPKPAIHWRKQHGVVPSRAGILPNHRHKFVITDLKLEDEGVYVCVAESVFGVAESSAQLFIYAAPKFTGIGPKRLTVLPTKPAVVLPCKASGYPQPKIRWSRHGASLPQNSFFHSNGSLVISEFSTRDNGRYVCRAENRHGHVTHSTYVSVYNETTYGLEIINNAKASIKCTICPFKNFKFSWKREDGKDLPFNRTKMPNCTLEISPVLMQDAGNYTCIASSRDTYSSQVLKDHVSLTVLGKAEIKSFVLEKPNKADIIQGDIIYVCPGDNVTCPGIGPPLPTVTWKRHGKQLTSGLGSATLQVNSILDEGAYSCHAENQFGTDEKDVVVLLSAFRFIERPPETLHLEVGAKADVHCSAALGGNSVDVSWSLPKCLSCSSYYKSSARDLGNGTLFFASAKIWDSGVYHCTAKAKGVTHTATVEINVGNQPTAEEWMLRTDNCGGFRQSTYDPRVFYAVSKSTTWSKTTVYSCPRGYYWASTQDGKIIFGRNDNWSGVYVYHDQCGWSSYTYAGYTRYYFRFRDSASNNAHKHAGNFDEHQLQHDSSTSNFAGIVCLKELA